MGRFQWHADSDDQLNSALKVVVWMPDLQMISAKTVYYVSFTFYSYYWLIKKYPYSMQAIATYGLNVGLKISSGKS